MILLPICLISVKAQPVPEDPAIIPEPAYNPVLWDGPNYTMLNSWAPNPPESATSYGYAHYVNRYIDFLSVGIYLGGCDVTYAMNNGVSPDYPSYFYNFEYYYDVNIIPNDNPAVLHDTFLAEAINNVCFRVELTCKGLSNAGFVRYFHLVDSPHATLRPSGNKLIILTNKPFFRLCYSDPWQKNSGWTGQELQSQVDSRSRAIKPALFTFSAQMPLGTSLSSWSIQQFSDMFRELASFQAHEWEVQSTHFEELFDRWQHTFIPGVTEIRDALTNTSTEPGTTSIFAGNEDTQHSSQELAPVKTDFSDSVDSAIQKETELTSSFSSDLEAIDLVNQDFHTNVDFIRSASFLGGLYNGVLNKHPVTELVYFALILGVLLMVLGKLN